MKLIVGLGNPGSSYEATRHNVGFHLIDALSVKYKIPLSEKVRGSFVGRGVGGRAGDTLPASDFLLAKPGTFMNQSGGAVRALLSAFQLEPTDLILIYDDLDMDCGRLRIRTKGSAGGHRGVASVMEAIGSDGFVRIKIGIGRNTQDPVDYVLAPFSKQEQAVIQKGIERGVEALPLLLEGRITEAMNRYNAPCD